jgi:hypothetical protein
MLYTVYKIQVGDDVYVGSTQNYMKRVQHHKFYATNGKDRAVYNAIRAAGGWNVKYIEKIEELECENRTQVEQREEYWKNQYNAALNMKLCHRSNEEYRRQKRESAKRWREANPDKVKQNNIIHSERRKNGYVAQPRKERTDAEREYMREYMRKYNAAKKSRAIINENPIIIEEGEEICGDI